MVDDKPNSRSIGWRPVKSAYLLENPWLKVRCDDLETVAGHPATPYTYVERADSVFIVPLTSDNRVILIRSFRYTLDDWCWEVPAGTMADNADSTPETVARKELKEETGFKCRDLVSLGTFFLGNGHSRHIGHFFLARSVEYSDPVVPEPLELIDRTEAIPVADAWSRLTEHPSDGDSVLAFLLAMRIIVGR